MIIQSLKVEAASGSEEGGVKNRNSNHELLSSPGDTNVVYLFPAYTTRRIVGWEKG